MKIRLYRGPFDGKVMDYPAGINSVRVSGPKKMTRKQRYEWYQKNPPWNFTMDASGNWNQNAAMIPRVDATYNICMGPGGMPLRHPDGSIFYEWDQPRKP